MPRKEIEAAEAEVASLGRTCERRVPAGLVGREALVAPVAGVIASSHVVAGQVVDARELVYEIVDPTRLSVEALTFDPELGANVGGATLAIGSERVPLQFLGAARTLREQALPLHFTAQGAALSQAGGRPAGQGATCRRAPKVQGVARAGGRGA